MDRNCADVTASETPLSPCGSMASTSSHPSVSSADSHPSVSSWSTQPSDAGAFMQPDASNKFGASSGVRRVQKSQYKQAAVCLAEAFKDDDIVRYLLCPDDQQNWSYEQFYALHLYVMECLVLAHIMKGQVTTIGPNFDCVALWMPPNHDFDDFFTLLRSGLLFCRWKMSKESRERFFTEFLPKLHDSKHEVLGEHDNDSWYLVYIGTHPKSRGKGYARNLISYTTDQAELENRITYLECSNKANISFYERLGFEQKTECVLTRAEAPVVMDIMTREPRIRKSIEPVDTQSSGVVESSKLFVSRATASTVFALRRVARWGNEGKDGD